MQKWIVVVLLTVVVATAGVLWFLLRDPSRTLRAGDGSGAILCLAFSPDGRQLMDGSRSWDVATGAILWTGDQACSTLAFSPDGKSVAAGGSAISGAAGRRGVVAMMEAATGKKLWVRSGGARSLAFSPDGRTLASAEEPPDGGTAVGDAMSGLLFWKVSGVARSVAFSPDGRALAVGREESGKTGDITLHDAATGRLQGRLTGHDGTVTALAFFADGKTLASASQGKGKDAEHSAVQVLLWNVETLQPKRDPAHDGAPMKLVHRGEVRSLAFSPDVSTLAVAVTRGEVSGLGAHLARPGEVHLWDLRTGRRRRVLKQSSGVHAVAFSGDGRTVATGGIDGSLKLWDVSP